MTHNRGNKYGVIKELWKRIAIPSITYGMNVLNWSETKMEKLRSVNNVPCNTAPMTHLLHMAHLIFFRRGDSSCGCNTVIMS